MSISEEIRRALVENAEEKYKAFHGSLVPTQEQHGMLGVRVPVMRRIAKQFAGREDLTEFLRDVPHKFYEENAVHSFLIEQIKDYDTCMFETEFFLPYIDNWAVCDCFSPKVFGNHKAQLFEKCKLWLQSEHTYTVRYALVMLLKHFLTEEYAVETLRLASEVDSEEYYINMAVSWLFAEAVGKCPELAIPYIEQGVLKTEVHNKAIQKTVESRRVPEATKSYLKTLKQKKEL
ncbi:MAG: DNA alkylation repair protein [Oscillospiraceae bacterium]|nr:DNA alkylation repair protein [Oscillospiraceae bacterium]